MNALAEYDDRLDRSRLAEIAHDVFLQSALQTTIIRGATLELFLTRLRSALIRLADANSRSGRHRRRYRKLVLRACPAMLPQ